MTERPPRLNQEEVAHTTANLKLAGKFIQELLEHPERRPTLPERTTIVLLPGDVAPDPELSWANMAMADHFSRQGQHVVTWPLDTPALSGPNLQPRWPRALGEGATMTYDGRRDVMTIVFSQSDQPAIPVRMNPSTTVLLDSETRFITSLTIANFLEEAVQKAPALGLYLLHPATTLVGLTKHERNDATIKVLDAVLKSTGATIEWQQLVEELSA